MLIYFVREGQLGFLIMPSEAQTYWQYAKECTRQALQTDDPKLRDQLLELARMWNDAAVQEEINAKSLRTKIG